ncbi:MAG: four helix bundle protein [Proteobacteria bacterium]|nr:four helix bundle protein [Pseudomonadota bacterium]
MAIHTDLPIYRTGIQLLDLAVSVQEQLPRGLKRIMGEKITQHCVDILELMALANASRHDVRAAHLEELLTRQRAVTVMLRVLFDRRHVSPKLWGQSVQLLGSIGKQAGGWLKTANRAPAA